jgi:hypothetical protein
MDTITDTDCYNSDTKIHDRTYGEWTVEWWKWALSTPGSINPVLDKSGKYSKINQPVQDVWFLAGKFGDEKKKYPQREVTIPKTKSILFPILNCEANSLEYPNLKSSDDLINHVMRDVDTVIKKECYIDGNQINPVRVRSDPAVFPLTIHEDNGVGVKGGGFTNTASDGYWVFLKSLPLGRHFIDFEGSCEFGRLCSGAKYHVTII